MKPEFMVFRMFLFRLLRDKFALFWTLIFPMFLLGILVLFFGNLTGEQMPFEARIALVDEDRGEISEVMVDVMKTISAEEGSWLLIEIYSDLEMAKEKLGEGIHHAVFRIPGGFSGDVMANVGGQFMRREELPNARIEILSREGIQISGIAATAMEQVVEVFNSELFLETGLMLPEDRIGFKTEMVQIEPGEVSTFNYVNYIVPGIILMAFIMAGLDELVTNLTSPRDKGILRRFFATPLKSRQYIWGLLFYICLISLLQLLIIYWFGRLVFSAQINLLSPLPLFFTVYSLLVLLGVGLLISTLAKNADAAGRIGNIIFYPMMFLGGLYFPIEGMPFFIRIISEVNPVTYLVNGLRDSLGVFPSSTSMEANILIPGLWLIVGLVGGIKRFRWDSAK